MNTIHKNMIQFEKYDFITTLHPHMKIKVGLPIGHRGQKEGPFQIN